MLRTNPSQDMSVGSPMPHKQISVLPCLLLVLALLAHVCYDLKKQRGDTALNTNVDAPEHLISPPELLLLYAQQIISMCANSPCLHACT
jgi:hypothetical protein